MDVRFAPERLKLFGTDVPMGSSWGFIAPSLARALARSLPSWPL
jgi:hypothetical protein